MAAILNSTRYSIREVARFLNIHIATVWRWHLRGVRGRKLPTVMIGGRRHVLADDLERFLADGNSGRAVDSSDLQRRAEDAGRALDGFGVTKSKPSTRVPRGISAPTKSREIAARSQRNSSQRS